MISEDLIARLIGQSGGGVRCVDMAERCADIGVVANRIFTLGMPSSKIKDLKDHCRVWDKIILGCFNHRKPTSSPHAFGLPGRDRRCRSRVLAHGAGRG